MPLISYLHLFVAAISIHSGFSQPNRRCDVPADVVFLMDASDSIKETEWEQEKDFVAALIDKLQVARYAIHVGVVVYSTDIGPIIDLQPFKTKAQLKDLLTKAAQINQGTDTAKGIRKLIEMSDNQGRLDAKQVAVIITDGRSTDVSSTIREARRARNEYNIDMIALGVGNETFLEELKEIAGPGNTDRLFEVQNFNQLLGVEAQLEEIICEIIPPTTSTTQSTIITTPSPPVTTSPYMPPFPCSEPADVVFLIDGSYSIAPEDWVKGKQFVSYLINGLDIGVQSINVGIVVYSSALGDVVDLRPFRGKNELRQAASGLIQPPVGRTNTGLGLQTVREMIRRDARPGVPHIAIVITDGMSSNISMTRDQAIMAKAEGIVIFVVGVGDRLLRKEVEDMASSPETIFDAPDFRYLVGMVELLRNNICTAIVDPSTPATTKATTPPVRPAIPDVCKQCLVDGGVGFNPMTSDCQQYVMCLPQGATYDPVVKTCPFGMFWSNEAVSCLDARYVACPYDKCKMMPEGRAYMPSLGGCRGYWFCTGRRSMPMCCDVGFRFQDGVGCSYDPSCRDPCPLDVTIRNEGACKYRPDPDTYYGYLEVIPGQGHVKRSCQPGQVYHQGSCACTYDAAKVIPQMGCTPSINVTFNGGFRSTASQSMEVRQVSITERSTAHFDGQGYLSWPGTSNMDIGDRFLVRLTYRMKTHGNSGGKAWNNHGKWGFENWFRNSSMHGTRRTVVVGKTPVNIPDKGVQGKIEEVVSITRNGTVVRDPRYDVRVDGTWPTGPLAKVNAVQLGQLATIKTPTFINGIVYIPNGRNSILIQEPIRVSQGGVTRGQSWKVVTVGRDGSAGTVVESGQGSVPDNIQTKYKFNLQPKLSERWFIVEPQGVVLQEGSGTIPKQVRDRYAGFTMGTLIKVFMDGSGRVQRWEMSRPDGSQMTQGDGDLPPSVTSKYKLTAYLRGGRVVKVWSVVNSDGTILESGQGNIPSSVMNKYKGQQSATLFRSSQGSGMETLWTMSRPSGVKVLEGRGSLPSGILSTIKGTLFPVQTATIRKWTVTLPNGTVQSGTGEIPQAIRNLFARMGGNLGDLDRTGNYTISAAVRGGSINPSERRGGNIRLVEDKLMDVVPVVRRAWTLTFPNGTKMSGEGQVPDAIAALDKFPNVLRRSSMSSTIPQLPKIGALTPPKEATLTGNGGGEMLSYLQAQLKGLSRSLRVKRASHTGQGQGQGQAHTNIMDLMANCGQTSSEPPSMHLFSSDTQVSFNVKTDAMPNGVTISLPVHEGLNDVTFVYNGVKLMGIANGIVRDMPLTGSILRKTAPIRVGRCPFRLQNTFHGELGMIQLYNCLP